MFRLWVLRTTAIAFLAIAVCGSVQAQVVYTLPPPVTNPTATPAPTQTSTTTSTTSTTTSTTTSSPPVTPVTTNTTSSAVGARASVSNVPGYTANGNYGPGRTAAYIIAPFAVVAGTYFLA